MKVAVGDRTEQFVRFDGGKPGTVVCLVAAQPTILLHAFDWPNKDNKSPVYGFA